MRTRLMLLAMAGIAACGDDQDPEAARELLDRVRAEDYRTWDRAPGYEERVASRAPHSDAVEIYVNDVVAEALTSGEALSEWPEGSIIVKDGWEGSRLELIALMEKREDGWFWAEFFGESSKFSGEPSVCVDCHRGGGDFVLAFGLPGE